MVWNAYGSTRGCQGNRRYPRNVPSVSIVVGLVTSMFVNFTSESFGSNSNPSAVRYLLNPRTPFVGSLNRQLSSNTSRVRLPVTKYCPVTRSSLENGRHLVRGQTDAFRAPNRLHCAQRREGERGGGEGDTAPPSTPTPTASAALRPSDDAGFESARLRGAHEEAYAARGIHADAHDMTCGSGAGHCVERRMTSFSSPTHL